MRTAGSPAELERRRRLALRRYRAGNTVEEIADMLEVTRRSVQRWVAAYRSRGPFGLKAHAATGRPPKLDYTQEKVIRRWLARSPADLGFTTDLWTTNRLAYLIRQTWDIPFNPRYLGDWLGRRGYTPQKPQRVPRERDEQAIAGWRRNDWPRIQKKCDATAGTSCSSTKAAC
jgi:transposase